MHCQALASILARVSTQQARLTCFSRARRLRKERPARPSDFCVRQSDARLASAQTGRSNSGSGLTFNTREQGETNGFAKSAKPFFNGNAGIPACNAGSSGATLAGEGGLELSLRVSVLSDACGQGCPRSGGRLLYGRCLLDGRVVWGGHVFFDRVLGVVVIVAEVFGPFVRRYGTGAVAFGVVGVAHLDI